MATIVEVDDPHDPRLADYRDLRDVELRKHLEAEHGLFLAEGEKVVRRAVEGGFPVRSFLMAPRWLDGLADVLATTESPCYVVSEQLAEAVTGFHVHRGALASLQRLPLPTVDAVLAERPDRRGARGRRGPHQRRGGLPERGRARHRRGAAGSPLRGPALPALGEGRRWGRCSRCRGPASTTGTTPCRGCPPPGSRPSR